MQISDTQKKEDIREAQIYLRVVAQRDDDIPMVVPDGVYSSETREAVKAFQKKYGLEATGEINAATWETLYREYLKAAEEFAPLKAITPLTRNNVPLGEGDTGFLIYILQAMINTVAQFYDNLEAIGINGVYGSETASAVKMLQEITGNSPTGITDIPTWNSLASLYNFHSAVDEKGSVTEAPSDENEAIPVSAENIGSVG